MFWKKKSRTIDILTYMKVPLKDADRIAGGMTRIDHECKDWSDLINQALKLAENTEQERLIWYLIGFRSGVLCDRTLLRYFYSGLHAYQHA